jgi:putative transposase
LLNLPLAVIYFKIKNTYLSMKNESIPLLPNGVYHICTHAVKNNNLFREPENYVFFLNRYKNYIPHVAHTFAYCQMPNHVHFSVQMKTEEELLIYFNTPIIDPKTNKILKTKKVSTEELPHLLSYQFSHLFNSYTKSYNKLYKCRGSLFERSFNRFPINDRQYFKTAICYILVNPIHHGFTNDFKEWVHSAYWHLVTDDEPTFLKRDTVFSVFGGKENFEKELDIYAKSKNWDFFE